MVEVGNGIVCAVNFLPVVCCVEHNFAGEGLRVKISVPAQRNGQNDHIRLGNQVGWGGGDGARRKRIDDLLEVVNRVAAGNANR